VNTLPAVQWSEIHSLDYYPSVVLKLTPDEGLVSSFFVCCTSGMISKGSNNICRHPRDLSNAYRTMIQMRICINSSCLRRKQRVYRSLQEKKVIPKTNLTRTLRMPKTMSTIVYARSAIVAVDKKSRDMNIYPVTFARQLGCTHCLICVKRVEEGQR
jgi:hypothetical protein